MKNVFSFLFCLASLIVNANPKNLSNSKIGIYAGFNAGIAITHNYNVKIASGTNVKYLPYKFGNMLRFNSFIGFSFIENFNLPIRTELEYSYIDRTVFDTMNWVEAKSLMINNYYDFYTLSFSENFSGYDIVFVPYSTLGLGATHTEVYVINPTDKQIHSKSSNFSFSIGFGVRAKIGDDFYFDAGYKYIRPNTLYLSKEKKYVGNLDIHNIFTGFSIIF